MALMAGTLRGDPAQSWINFKPKKGEGVGISSLAMQGKFLALVAQD